MTTSLHASYALTQPTLPLKTAGVVDVLLTFRAEHSGGSGPAPRLPLNVSIVIDRSGSMSGNPLKQAIAAAEVLVGQLEGSDTVSVVAYDSTVSTIVPPQKVTDPAAICKDIRKIKTKGATNLSGGWLQGCQHVQQRPGERLVRRVLLLTDGQANSGITEPKKLIAEAKKQADKGLMTTTLGFGSGFNEDLLIGMAEASGGNFYFIETPEDACQVFQIEGESLTTIAAQNLTLTLTPAEGVKVREVLNYPVQGKADELSVAAGEVYGAEDKLIALALEVPAQARAKKSVPLLEVAFSYEPVGGATVSGELSVSAPVGGTAGVPNFEVLKQFARIRIAKAKENAVALADTNKRAEAAAVLREVAAELRQKKLDDEFEIAEEIEQLEHFAGTIEAGQLGSGERKVLRDQSYQGRTRNRADLSGRGSGDGSTAGMETTDAVGSGVEVTCVREGGKLRMRVVSPGYETDFNVQFPRNIRAEGTHYVVEKLETSSNGTFYRAAGSIKRLTKPTKTAAVAAAAPSGPAGEPGDPYKLTELFTGGEPWMPLLKPVIEAQPDAGTFIGPHRQPSTVPVRELTFQALKPNPPERWKVVVFGQNPYPRIESATGIAMFDDSFHNWADSQFGKVPTIRCIIKAAAMWKHKVAKNTAIADLRKLLATQNAVQPPEWFQAILTQGVLLLNAALTASSDGSMTTDQHTAFWRPVVERLVEEIFKAKQNADDKHKGVVFAWWGAHARALRKVVEKLQKQYAGVPVRHIDHCNPAAQGDIFCDGNHFADINKAVTSLGMEEVDWLPNVGWNKGASGDAERMGEFITRTQELHKFYLERLQEVKEEAQVALPPVLGVMAAAPLSFSDAIGPLAPSVAGLEYYAKRSFEYGTQNAKGGELSADEVAAVFLYTTESSFYKRLNHVLRDPDREKVKPFFGYLRLLLAALSKLTGYTGSLWRGVAADLRGQYPKDRMVTWWGISSCTAKRSVASSFLGSSGRRMLFEVVPKQAVSIRRYSAFTGEDEYLLPPGTQLKVTNVDNEKSGLCTVKLEEQAGERLVN